MHGRCYFLSLSSTDIFSTTFCSIVESKVFANANLESEGKFIEAWKALFPRKEFVHGKFTPEDLRCILKNFVTETERKNRKTIHLNWMSTPTGCSTHLSHNWCHVFVNIYLIPLTRLLSWCFPLSPPSWTSMIIFYLNSPFSVNLFVLVSTKERG